MSDITKIQSVNDIPTHLDNLIDDLAAACRNTEPDFLKIGKELRSVKADTDLMTRQIHTAVDYIEDAIEREALQKVRAFAEKSMTDVKNIRQGANRDLKHVQEVAKCMGSINRLCGGTETITTFLRVISFNMAVKSAHSRNAEETFKGFAEEAKKVADNFSAITSQLGSDAQTVQNAQNSTHEEIMADSIMLEDLARATDSALQNAVGASEKLMAHSRNVLTNASLHTQTIARQVSEIVVNIQFHDSMSQRIADICENLRQIETTPANGTDNNESLPLHGADLFLNHQGEELNLIITELDNIYHKNLQAFEKIESDTDLLAQSLNIDADACSLQESVDTKAANNPSDDDANATEPDDPFVALQSALESLYEVLCKGQDLTEQIEKSVVYAVEKTSRFAKQARKVHRIGYEAHIMALNAGVKASKLDHQRQTFAVMAQEITSLARQSQAFVSKIEQILKSVGALNLKTQKDLSEQASLDQAGAITMVKDRIQAVSEAFHQFKSKSTDVCQVVEGLRQKIGGVKSGLYFLPTLADALTNYKHLIDLFSRIAQVWKSKAREPTADQIELLVQECKAMFEQDVVRQSGGQGLTDESSQSADAANYSAPNISDDEEFGDNVELF